MKPLLRAWDRFFFSRYDPYSLAFLRISTGILWLVLHGFLYFSWERFYGVDGIAGINDPSMWNDWWNGMTWTDGLVSIWAWWWLGLVVGVLYTLGLMTRLMTILLWFILSTLVHRNIIVVGAEELVLRMTLWWCMFLPLGRSVSIDAWIYRKRLAGRPDERPLPMIWALRMLQINALCIYACSLPLKLTTDGVWLDGDAFFYAVISDTWSRWPWPWMFYPKWMSMLGTYGAILVEGSIAVLVWTRWRVQAVLVMWVFHLMLGAMLDNVAFFSMAAACNLWVFIPADTARGWVRSVTNLRLRPRPAISDVPPTAMPS